jgi:hypothetical protein
MIGTETILKPLLGGAQNKKPINKRAAKYHLIIAE